MESNNNNDIDSLAVAVIGMSLRFPGAKNPDEFWQNLINGVESIKFFTDDELLKEGVDPTLLKDPNYVKAAPVLDDVEYFDASFFNFSPGEANILDPQRRLFLECGWEVFENAGYDPSNIEDSVGVYAGAGINLYLLNNLMGNEQVLSAAGEQQVLISSDKDHLPTHLSYNLNLTGPSVNVNTACSSSLVAIHLARQSLLLGECDMAIAGGSSIIIPNRVGYTHVEDSILSSDGHCRAFDADGDGTIWGSGCGVVLLKRLEDAIEDGDNIRAVIKGSAINNDGSQKVGFTAPSIEGQVEVVAQALANADLESTDISYIEAHGTGTKLGDPIEIAALDEVFTDDRQAVGKCAIGSVKTNIGHLGAAAGVAGFIKTVLALENKMIPPSLNYNTPNPKIDFERNNFFVNTKTTEWEKPSGARNAGVSSLAVGGTNAHIILGEAPEVKRDSFAVFHAEPQVIVISARSPLALDEAVSQLAGHLEKHPDVSLMDVAFTLQSSRSSFSYRKAFICTTIAEAIAILKENEPDQLLDRETIKNNQDFEWSTSTQKKLMFDWLNGEDVDWSLNSSNGKRIILPTYPFERSKFWIEPATNVTAVDDILEGEKKPDMSDWFYEVSWKRSTLPRDSVNMEKATYLVFTDECNIGYQVIEKLKEFEDDVVTVIKGTEYRKFNDLNYVICPSRPSDYNELCVSLMSSDKIPNAVLHFYSVTDDRLEPEAISIDSIKQYQTEGFYSLLYLTQALSSEMINSPISYFVFTNNLHDITGFERLRPEKGSIIGQCKVIQQEFLNITCRTVDFTIPTYGSSDAQRLIENLTDEIKADTNNLVVAYRQGKRWVQTYEPIRIEDEDSCHRLIKDGGIYLVYDGLVGIGLEMSKYLLREKRALVLVLSDPYFPSEDEWNEFLAEDDIRDDTTSKIKGVKELIEMGAVYLGPIPFVDSRGAAIAQLIDRAEEQHGAINGVLHCAGGSVDGHLRPIDFSYYDIIEEDFTSITYTLLIFNEIFENRNLDFRVVMSSLGSILGGLNFTSYSASSYLSLGYIQKMNKISQLPWVVQCWDSWTIEWNLDDYKNTVLHDAIVDKQYDISLTSLEGVHCFERTLTFKENMQIAISCTCLNARYKKWVEMGGALQDESKESGSRHPRPDLPVEYVAPTTQIEKDLTSLFEDLLEIDGVGIYDNFFDMGGHSLLATQFNTMLRGRLNIDLPINIFFENSTVDSLARIIEDQ